MAPTRRIAIPPTRGARRANATPVQRVRVLNAQRRRRQTKENKVQWTWRIHKTEMRFQSMISTQTCPSSNAKDPPHEGHREQAMPIKAHRRRRGLPTVRRRRGPQTLRQRQSTQAGKRRRQIFELRPITLTTTMAGPAWDEEAWQTPQRRTPQRQTARRQTPQRQTPQRQTSQQQTPRRHAPSEAPSEAASAQPRQGQALAEPTLSRHGQAQSPSQATPARPRNARALAEPTLSRHGRDPKPAQADTAGSNPTAVRPIQPTSSAPMPKTDTKTAARAAKRQIQAQPLPKARHEAREAVPA